MLRYYSEEVQSGSLNIKLVPGRKGAREPFPLLALLPVFLLPLRAEPLWTTMDDEKLVVGPIPGKPSRKSRKRGRKRAGSFLNGMWSAGGLFKMLLVAGVVYCFSFWVVVVRHREVVSSEQSGHERKESTPRNAAKRAKRPPRAPAKGAAPAVPAAKAPPALARSAGGRREDCPSLDTAAVLGQVDFSTLVPEGGKLSPWLAVVVPVVTGDFLALRKTVRSIVHEVTSTQGRLMERASAVQVLVVNFGGAAEEAAIKRVRKEDLVAGVGQEKPGLLDQFVFVDAPMFPGCVSRGGDLAPEGVAALFGTVAALYQAADDGGCHSFLTLKPGDTFCQFGLLYTHYALAKADEYDEKWTSVRLSQNALAGVAWRCDRALLARASGWVTGQFKGSWGASSKASEAVVERFMDEGTGLRPMVYKQTLAAGACGDNVKSFDAGACPGNDIFPCKHSRVDTHFQYRRVPIFTVDDQSITVVGGNGQSCSDACREKTGGALACDGAETGRLSSCYNLQSLLPCTGGCVPDKSGLGFPGVTVDDLYVNTDGRERPVPLHKGTCLYAVQRPSQTGCSGGKQGIKRACACRKFDKPRANERKESTSGRSGPPQRFAGEPGQSCDEVCASKGKGGLRCDASMLGLVNNCEAMQALFHCKKCDQNEGADQPCFVPDTNKGMNTHGECLLKGNVNTFTCNGKHPSTQRGCVCR